MTVFDDGHHVRDYVFIDDVVSAFLTAGSHSSELSGNYYVIGSGQGFRIVDAINLVADRVKLLHGYRPQVQHVPAPEGLSPIEERDFVADTGLFQAATNWRANVTLEQGIDRTIEYTTHQAPAYSEFSA